MSTQRKNLGNYASPYAKACSIYPSQSEDYLSLNAGGPGSSAPQAPRRQGGGNFRYSSPAKYNNRDSGTCYFYQDSRGGATVGGGQQKQNYYRNNYTGGGSSGRGNGNRWSHGRGGGGGFQKHRSPASKEESFALYFHPTMLDDPWKDLIERLKAIRKSEVTLQSKNENAGVGSSSETESGNENEKQPAD